MELIALLMMAPLVGLYFLSGLRQIQQWEAPLKFTVGRYSGRLEPGLTWIIPGIQRIIRVDTRIRNKDLFQQQVITADNVTASIDAVIYYKVVDPEKAVLNVQDYDHAVRDRAKVVLRDIVGETRLDDLLAHREEIALKVRKAVEQFVSQWGLHVEAIAMQDIQLPQQMQEVIARVAIAERDRQYVVIKSRADVESAKNFAQAAEILASSPGAMELRRLEALQNMSGRTSRVIFDLAKPYDDTRTRVAATAMALGESEAPRAQGRERGEREEAEPGEEEEAPIHESQARRAAR